MPKRKIDLKDLLTRKMFAEYLTVNGILDLKIVDIALVPIPTFRKPKVNWAVQMLPQEYLLIPYPAFGLDFLLDVIGKLKKDNNYKKAVV